MKKLGTVSALTSFVAASALLAFSDAPARAESFSLLRGEGATLYLRHASSDWTAQGTEIGTTDAARLDARHCEHHRRLTDAGRQQAEAIRTGLKSIGMESLDVYAAGLCRTFETARMFGAPHLLAGLTPGSSGVLSLQSQTQAIDAVVKSGRGKRGLRIVVGDYEIARALYGTTLAEGDGLILRSDGDKVEVLGRIRVGDWTALQPVAADARETDRRKF